MKMKAKPETRLCGRLQYRCRHCGQIFQTITYYEYLGAKPLHGMHKCFGTAEDYRGVGELICITKMRELPIKNGQIVQPKTENNP